MPADSGSRRDSEDAATASRAEPTIRLAISVYPPYRKLVGADRIEVDLPPGSTVRDLLLKLGQRHPVFRQLASAPSDEFFWGQLIVHVNEEIAGLGTILQSGDRLDLLPPIAGGASLMPPGCLR